MGRTGSTPGEPRNTYKILIGKPEKKRPLGRCRRGLEDKIKIDIKETGHRLNSTGSEHSPEASSCEH
jgi:hypothetical protein